jgi:hypothetical protein
MDKVQLPVIDPARTEFGFSRTVCACSACTANCRNIPGYLIPADLERLRDFLSPGEDLLTWAHKHLLASPGALVARHGQMFRIPTLVPARQSDVSCHFLTPEGRCAVHPVAPFGCAFFDSHMTSSEADARSSRGLREVLGDCLVGGPYAEDWAALSEAGLWALPPEISRALLQEAARTGIHRNGSAGSRSEGHHAS